MARPFIIKRNDLSRSLKSYLRASPASNFTGATVVFNMSTKDGTKKITRGTASLGNDADGDFATYDWQAGDTDTLGDYEGEFEVILASGKPETYPNDNFIDILITKDLG